jgi:hypothetical protein
MPVLMKRLSSTVLLSPLTLLLAGKGPFSRQHFLVGLDKVL